MNADQIVNALVFGAVFLVIRVGYVLAVLLASVLARFYD